MNNIIKKTTKITGIVACVAFLFFNLTFNGKVNSNDIKLTDMIKIGKADAECYEWRYGDTYGRCLPLSQLCVFDTDRIDCDPYES